MTIAQDLLNLINDGFSEQDPQRAILLIFQKIMEGEKPSDEPVWKDCKEDLLGHQAEYAAIAKNYDSDNTAKDKLQGLFNQLRSLSLFIADALKKLARSNSPSPEPKKESDAKVAETKTPPPLTRTMSLTIFQPTIDKDLGHLIKNTKDLTQKNILVALQANFAKNEESIRLAEYKLEIAGLKLHYEALKNEYKKLDADNLCNNLKDLSARIAKKFQPESKDDADYVEIVRQIAKEALSHYNITKSTQMTVESKIWNPAAQSKAQAETLHALKDKLTLEPYHMLKVKIQHDEKWIKQGAFLPYNWMKEIPEHFNYSDWANLVTTDIADKTNRYQLWYIALLQIEQLNSATHDIKQRFQQNPENPKTVDDLTGMMMKQLEKDKLKRLVCKSTPALKQETPKKPTFHHRAATFAGKYLPHFHITSPTSPKVGPRALDLSPKTAGSANSSPIMGSRNLFQPNSPKSGEPKSAKKDPANSPPSSPRSGKK